MPENELFAELRNIDNNSSSQQIEAVYNHIFSQMAHDHSGVYYAEKIDWIEKLVNIYHHTVNNPKKSILISAMLNNLYYPIIKTHKPPNKLKICWQNLLMILNNFGKFMKKTINVAVAIIHFGEKYLLGYRNASQHQGEKYEFIGGKIEPNESPKQGLIREVFEEIGCDISQNLAIKMGVIRHDYIEKDKPDKSVALHCFKIELNQSQFDSLRGDTGTEGQAITWVNYHELILDWYDLPDANAMILYWLELPQTILITCPLEKFDNEIEWLNFHQQKNYENAKLYIRPNSDSFTNLKLTKHLIQQLGTHKIVAFQTLYEQSVQQKKTIENLGIDLLNTYINLNHNNLLTLNFADLPKNLYYFASCHDEESIRKVNQLTETHKVMGCFLSPVLATPTHPETITNGSMGWEKFAELAEMSNVPVYGLGGLGQTDLGKVWENNGFGIAGIRLIEAF